MTLKPKNKKKNKNEFKIANGEKVIKALFGRPLEALRIMYQMDGELYVDVIKKIMLDLDIVYNTARGHMNKVFEANFFTQEEDGRLYKNDKHIKWLWSYLMPLYPRAEQECLETMLFDVSTKFNKMALAKTKKYTQRIEDAITNDHKYEIDEVTRKKIFKTIWNVFSDENIKTDLY